MSAKRKITSDTSVELAKVKEQLQQEIIEKTRRENDLQEHVDRYWMSMNSIISLMSKIIEVRDPYTAGHQQRVASLASCIARKLGYSADEAEGVRVAGLLHDIGKIIIPSDILSKPMKLCEAEYMLIKTHPQVGYDILKTMEFPWPVARIVYQHHERINGSGYPTGLAGSEILREAKILGVADVVEAMTHHRPYRPALGIKKALNELKINKGILYDVETVEACLELFASGGFSW